MNPIEILSLLLSILTFGLLWRHLLSAAQGVATKKASFILPWCALVLVLTWLSIERVFAPDGINFNFYNSLILASCVINLFTLVSISLNSMEYLGVLVLPITLITVLLGLGSPEATTSPILSIGMQVHIMTSLIAFSILGLAAVQAIFLYLQETSLRNHISIGMVRVLPSMHDSERLLFQFIITGLLILTISLATGFIFIEDIFAQHLAHKTTLSCTAWLVFLTLILGRLWFGWRGRTAVKLALGGYASLILAYYGSKFVLELIL